MHLCVCERERERERESNHGADGSANRQKAIKKIYLGQVLVVRVQYILVTVTQRGSAI